MAVPLEQFVKQLEDSGILAGDTLKDFIPPKASPKDAEDLARELVRNKKLTKFQAEEVYKGKAKSLVLGNYLLMEKIGAGGMGQVFKARHRRMDRIVAVKLLPAAMTKDKAAIARFEREVMAAAKISHPNIVAAYDADSANGVRFLVMECVEGSDLSALVKKNGPFPVDRAVNYILQAARGLEAAHAGGIVHRDIKPANLLLDKSGVVKILDMGLARLNGASDDPTEAELTKSGTIMGTVDYMAPEQAMNTKSADARADIYSLGCSLFYLLAGKATFSGDSLMAKLVAHREHPIPSLRDARPEVPEQIDAVFRRMLAKKIEDRYQSMTAVIADLEKCVSGREQSIYTPPSFSSSAESGLTDFLKDVSLAPKKPTKQILQKPKKATLDKDWLNKNKQPLLIGGGVLGGLLLLMGVIVSLRTKEGTLTVKVNEPDAEVQVLTEDGEVEITRKSERGRITISVDPGKHRLKVVKDGFKFYAKDFEMESGGNETITARLVPLEEKPAVVGTTPAPVADGTKKPLFFATPAFDQWVKVVEAMPTEKQVEAVSKKLVELNPGFDGKVTPGIQNGVATHLTFLIDNVTDISPVRGLVSLSHLTCTGSTPNGRLADLSPLKGMPLKTLALYNSQVADLSPLTGMKLTNLHCGSTNVADLSPLRDMPLEGLYVNRTQVSNLSLLTDMPLTHVYCDFKPYRDTELLHSIPTLEMINEKPVAEFWREVEVQQAAFDQWMKQVAEMPAEQQVKVVSKKLQELNPGFDGQVTPTIESSVVAGLQFFTDNVTDISPVRALKRLRTLVCTGRSGAGALSNLSPLKGMALTTLNCSGNVVIDLSPLQGMPLTELDFAYTHVSDMSPLQGMSLKTLVCAFTKVSDLSPLEGMPLTDLHCYRTQVADLSPLQGMSLTDLNCGVTGILDLSPLKGMPLTSLNIGTTQVADLSPLEGMKLTTLEMGETGVSDLSPLINLPLTALSIYRTPVTNITPLQGLKLTSFSCASTTVADFSPLKEMPLKQLSCDFKPFRDTDLLRSITTLETINGNSVVDFWKEVETQQAAFDQWIKQVAALPAEQQVEAVSKKLVELNPGFDGKVTPTIEGGTVKGLQFFTDNVSDISPVQAFGELASLQITGSNGKIGRLSDLSPLRTMPISTLVCVSNEVSDLSPLTGMKLTMLDCSYTKVADLSPLREMQLQALTCHFTSVADLSSLKGMPMTYLVCNRTQVADISPLVGMKLTLLDCSATNISDVLPLKGMPLMNLSVATTQVADLSPLKDMGLKTLDISGTQIADLAPLRGMQLTILNIDGTLITDISPLRGMPLTELMFFKTRINNLSPLKEMPLKILAGDFVLPRDDELLRSIKTLEIINGKSAAEFWKEVEGKQSGK